MAPHKLVKLLHGIKWQTLPNEGLNVSIFHFVVQ